MTSVVFIPGSSSAAHSFRDVAPLMPDGWTRAFHDMPGHVVDAVAANVTWSAEVESLAREIARLDGEVYVVALSAGASLALAYVDAHPDRLAGLALIEPAWIFCKPTGRQSAYYAQLDRVLELSPAQQPAAFRSLLVTAGVRLPAVKPEWDEAYEAGIAPSATPLARSTRAMLSHRVKPDYLSRFHAPVFFAVGGQSNPMWRDQAEQFRSEHAETVVEVFSERHHLDAPHHKNAQAFAAAAWRPGEGPGRRSTRAPESRLSATRPRRRGRWWQPTRGRRPS